MSRGQPTLLAGALKAVPSRATVLPDHDAQPFEAAAGALDVTTEPLTPGTYVTPSIRLARKLGEGGMGSVWVAFHLGLRTDVVVKFISANQVDSGEAVARFEREAALAALAKSPHVVQLFDYGISQGGLPYITMELLEGEDLGSRIAREGAIAPTVLAGWITQACRGLQRAHAKGIVHRDIKPENIFLCNNEGDTLVKVLDFGIAKGAPGIADAAGTLTSALIGTPCYMSPEQVGGAKNIDHRSDLWALAVLVYYALTGSRPFDQTSLSGLVAAITTLPIAPPSNHNAALPAAIDAWMGKALQREPSARFESAKEFAQSFALAVHDAGAAGATVHAPWSGAAVNKVAGAGVRVTTRAARRTAAVVNIRHRLVWMGAAAAALAVGAVALAFVKHGAVTSGPPAPIVLRPALLDAPEAGVPVTVATAAVPTDRAATVAVPTPAEAAASPSVARSPSAPASSAAPLAQRTSAPSWPVASTPPLASSVPTPPAAPLPSATPPDTPTPTLPTPDPMHMPLH